MISRPAGIPDHVVELQTDKEQRTSDTAMVTTILAVTVTFMGGYGLGVNDTDVRVTILVGAFGLLLFALIINFNHVRQQSNPFFRWVSKKTSFSSISLGKMASKGSGNALSTLSRVTSVDAIRNISKNLLSTLDCSKSLRSALQSITRKECFARTDYIERLSINDVSVLFRYAAEANLDGFDTQEFLNDQSEIVRSVINAIDMAVKVSRGSQSEGARRVSMTERSEGDIDALSFVAVARIFAEWRNLRMVPKGYQRYAVGLSLAYRDVLQNLEKIERGVHTYLKHHQNKNNESNNDSTGRVPSPTLRQLLQFELRSKVHNKLPCLKEHSAASGILWTKRQLHYQTTVLSNTLEVPYCYATPKDAANAAYHLVYNDYHGWAVKKIFTHSFGGSPPLDKVWLSICPPTDLPKNRVGGKQNFKSDNKGKRNRSFPPPPLRQLSDVNSSNASHVSTSESFGTHEDDDEVKAALDNLRHGMIEKWEDLVRMFNCGKDEKKKQRQSLILSSESHFNLNQLNTEMVEASLDTSASTDVSDMNSIGTTSSFSSELTPTTFANQKQEKIGRSKRDVEDFVRDVSPMMAEISSLMDELNMNDPTRV